LSEYEAQKQWTELDDRLTFILLDRSILPNRSRRAVAAMIGDINLFLTPQYEDSGDKEAALCEDKYELFQRVRGQGLAAEALAGFLQFVGQHLPHKLSSLVAKVSMENKPSIRLFQNRLGFVERSRLIEEHSFKLTT
uniref:N-acetyltransferase domain-containing protein n=1 Tax=Echinostoma caproni TaxID=27848 RepID=A0A183B647_9TREM